MRAKTINGSSVTEIKEAVAASMADGFQPTLAIVFISIKQDRNGVCKILNSNGIDLIGATSSGERG